MASMTEIICKCGCGRKKMVRTADVKRGWGKFFDKKCKAKYQEKRTHQNAQYHDRQEHTHNKQEDDWDRYLSEIHPFSCEGLGQWDD